MCLLSMAVDDLHPGRAGAALGPFEADPPPVVDADAPLPPAPAPEADDHDASDSPTAASFPPQRPYPRYVKHNGRCRRRTATRPRALPRIFRTPPVATNPGPGPDPAGTPQSRVPYSFGTGRDFYSSDDLYCPPWPLTRRYHVGL